MKRKSFNIKNRTEKFSAIFLARQNNNDADYRSDILAHARAIYLLCKFDITSLRFVAI